MIATANKSRWTAFPTVDFLTCELAGATTNDSRQNLIRTVYTPQWLQLSRDPLNQFDSNAIQVNIPNGGMIGYIPADTAEFLSERYAFGFKVAAFAREIHPSVEGLSVMLVIGCARPDVSTSEFENVLWNWYKQYGKLRSF